MDTDRMKSPFRLIGVLSCAAALALPVAGCGHPSAANIQLRKENADLRKRIEGLDVRHASDQATIRFFEQNRPTTEHLAQDRLEKLFTAHGLQLGKLTGEMEASADPNKMGLMVYAVPVDEAGDELKAAGAFVVEAFDLAEPDHPLLARWTFDSSQSRSLFYGQVMQYTFALPCPWKQAPKHEAVTIKVTFTDELTGRTFDAQKVVKVKTAESSSSARTQ